MGSTASSGVVAVHLHTKVTEAGQLEVWCQGRYGQAPWKLEFGAWDKRGVTRTEAANNASAISSRELSQANSESVVTMSGWHTHEVWS